MDYSYHIRLRQATETQWTLSNPILANGEPGYITESQLFKVGDGVTPWNDLPYAPKGLAGSLQVGTTTTGPPGSDATVVNSGTSSEAVLDFTIPRGAGTIPGGVEGQSITKNSDATDYDVRWEHHMRWKGVWSSGTYIESDVVRDGSWLMVANKTTTEQAAPQPSGDISELLPSWNPSENSEVRTQVTFSNEWTLSSSGWITSLTVEVEPDNVNLSYTVGLYVDGVAKDTITFDPYHAGIKTLEIYPILVVAGSVVEFRVVITPPGNQKVSWSEEIDLFTTPPENCSSARGYLNGTWSNTAYGCSVSFQPGTKSDDWDVLTYFGSTAGSYGSFVSKLGDTMAGDLTLSGDWNASGSEPVPGANQREIVFATTDYPEQDVALRGEVGDVNLAGAGTGLILYGKNEPGQNIQLEVNGGPSSAIWVNGTMAGGDTGWLPLSGVGYASPWADHNAQWKPYYRRVNGFVYFRGLVKATSAVSSGALIVTMPVGYRMADLGGYSNGSHFLVAAGDYANQYIRVYGSGRIDIGSAEGANVWVSLDTVRYPVD